MHMQSVQSSNIKSVGHDPSTQKLRIEFKSGQTHEYDGISTDQHRELLRSDSIGKHFNSNIKNHCAACRKVS